MAKSTSSWLALALGSVVLITGCQSKEYKGNVPVEYFQGTTLDRHEIKVAERTHYLEVNLDPRDSQLRLDEISKVRGFLADYNYSGHGPLVVSMPKYAENPQLAVGAVAEIRELAWEAGIEYEEMMGAAYNATGKRATPVVMAFKSYKTIAPDCPSLAQIDVANAVSNSDLPSLGCSVRSNMAAMIAEPADLLGGREMTASDVARRELQLEQWRNGQNTASVRSADESGAVSQVIN